MPKIKTHKSAKRRIHVTGTGKFMHSKVGKSHLRMAKSARTKRQYSVKQSANPANVKKLRRLLPYA